MAFYPPKTTQPNLYTQDFYLWLEETVKTLRNRNFTNLDLDNLIEELESMGRSEKTALRSCLRVVLMHLLKYKYQPEKRSNSLLYTIFEHRKRIQEAIEGSPSLKPYFQEVFEKCYQDARKEASLETGLNLNIFPVDSPFTPEETLDSEYLPQE